MNRKRRIGLSAAARQELLDKIADCRRAATRVLTDCAIRGPEYMAATEALRALDQLEGLIDGGDRARRRFHSTS